MAIHYFDPKDSEKQIKSFAWKVLRRLHAAGARTLQLEDIEGELWLAWCIACERYNSQAGASFKTFLHRGMQLHINRWSEKHVERRHAEVVAYGFDHTVSSDRGQMDNGHTLGEMLADENAITDEDFSNGQSLAYVKSRLSPRAALFVQILNDQPQELLDEVLRLEDKAAYAKSERNITVNLNHRLTYVMILDLMGASRNERRQILEEVAEVSDHYCQQVAA